MNESVSSAIHPLRLPFPVHAYNESQLKHCFKDVVVSKVPWLFALSNRLVQEVVMTTDTQR